MMHYLSFRNKLAFLCSIYLAISYFSCTANAFDRYPHVFPKCCGPKGWSSADAISMSPGGHTIGQCGNEGSEVVLLPKRLFPSISTDLEHVEVELRNAVDLDRVICTDGRDYLRDTDFSDFLDNETSGPVGEGRMKGFGGIAFFRDQYLYTQEGVYSPGHFCVSSRTTDTARVVIKTIRCRQPFLSIPRCCGAPGQESILISPPASQDASLLDLCSTPTLQNNSWNPYTSKTLRVNNHIRFNQTRYAPHSQEYSGPYSSCTLFRLKLKDEFSLAFLGDGHLLLTRENTMDVVVLLDNFCIDGINEGAGGNSPGVKRETPEEAVVVFDCTGSLNTLSRHSSSSVRKIVTLPACSDLVPPPDPLILLHQSLFKNGAIGTKVAVALTLATGENGGSLKCPFGYDNLILNFEATTGNYLGEAGWLVLKEFDFRPWEFCIRNMFQNALGLRVCHEEDRNLVKSSLHWWMQEMLIPTFIVPVLFYVAIAVVYIFRKDKEPVFRCSIVAFCISTALACVILPPVLYFDSPRPTKMVESMGHLGLFFYAYGFSWMSVLCFDVWLTIMFLRPGRKSIKRLWSYVAFTLAFPTVVVGLIAFSNYLRNLGDQEETIRVLRNLLWGAGIGLICINFLLFVATAVKLWITQHSSDIQNQIKTFLLYFKLFFLVGLRWVTDFFFFMNTEPENGSSLRLTVALILLVFHPVLLFFFLAWDKETKRYLETNYPRVKRVLDFIRCIGYPVRKCWGLCRPCKRPEDEGTNGNGVIEPPHCSTHMYVHRGRVPNTPK